MNIYFSIVFIIAERYIQKQSVFLCPKWNQMIKLHFQRIANGIVGYCIIWTEINYLGKKYK